MKIYAIVALLVLVVSPALADNTGNSYVAVDLGSAAYSGVTVAAGTYPNPGVINIAVGYHFNPELAVEFGYSSFGKSTLNISSTVTADVTASSLQISAVGSLPLSSKVDLIGKLGIANNSNSLNVQVSNVTTSYKASQSTILMGLGADFHINSHFNLRAQYLNFGKFGNFGLTGKPMEASAYFLGVALDI